MHRTDGDNNINNRFTDNIPGTIVGADWLNAVQEEIVGVIEGAGMSLNSPSADTANQLLAAILSHIDEAIAAKTLADYPIGDIYVQYPVAESDTETTAFPTALRPATKFGGTWSELYDDENVFFRTKGTDGQLRTTGLSEDQMQKITGTFSVFAGMLNTAGAQGAFSILNVVSVRTPNGTGTGYSEASFDSANSPNARVSTDTTGFTEPRNRLFKVWIRTA